MSQTDDGRAARANGTYELSYNTSLILAQSNATCQTLEESDSGCSTNLTASTRSAEKVRKDWLPPRDSNPDMLIQSQLSCR